MHNFSGYQRLLVLIIAIKISFMVDHLGSASCSETDLVVLLFHFTGVDLPFAVKCFCNREGMVFDCFWFIEPQLPVDCFL